MSFSSRDRNLESRDGFNRTATAGNGRPADEASVAALGETSTQLALRDPDIRLMLRVRDDEPGAFEELVEAYQHRLVAVMHHLVGNAEEAEDLAQEVFLRVYRSRATYEPTAKFTTWLFRIATHLALNWLRDGRHEKGQERLDDDVGPAASRDVADRTPSVEHSLVRQARLEEVRRAVQMLPEKQRAAVLMHKYEEMEYSQIAVVLSCSESAVKSLLFRAYETLRARLAHMA